MWAKGPTPGHSPKTELLNFVPGAVCQRMTNERYRLTGYFVYPTKKDAKEDTNVMSSACSSKEAWEKALALVATYDCVDDVYNVREDSRFLSFVENTNEDKK